MLRIRSAKRGESMSGTCSRTKPYAETNVTVSSTTAKIGISTVAQRSFLQTPRTKMCGCSASR